MALKSMPDIGSGMISAFFRVDHACFAGYVVDKNDMSRQFVVQIFIDSLPYTPSWTPPTIVPARK